MTVLVVSDSHGHARYIDEVLSRQEAVGSPDWMLYLGDGIRDLERCELPSKTVLLCVRGNCDIFADEMPYERLLTLGESRILMMHGHTRGVKMGLEAAIGEAVRQSADILLYGHTHRPHEQVLPAGSNFGGIRLEKELSVFNPGSLAEGSFGLLTLGAHGLLKSHGKLF